MTSGAPETVGSQQGSRPVQWTTRALIARHKRSAAGLAVGLLILIALFVVALVGPRGGAVSDSTSCTQWGSSNQSEQHAYGELYLREHGRRVASTVSGVEAAINAGCMAAFASDEEDTVTVLDAIEKNY